MRHAWRCVGSLLVLALLGACGGGGGGGPTDPSGGGTLTGNLGRDAGGATVTVEGTSYRAQANADGGFRIDNVPSGEYTLGVTAPNGDGGAVVVRVTNGQTTTVDNVILRAAGQIAGLVTSWVDGGLQPVAGARVTVRLVSMLWDYADDAEEGVLAGVEAVAGAAGRQRQETQPGDIPPRVATTDSNGSFRLAGVVPGPYSVEVTAEGYQSGESGTYVGAGGTSPVDVVLVAIDPDNATVSGTVRDDEGDLLAYVWVSLWPTDDYWVYPSCRQDDPDACIDPWYLPPFSQSREAYTDEQGRYTISNIPPGDYVLSFWRYGYEEISRKLPIAAREERTENASLTFILAAVSGTVYARDEAGALSPVAGAYVDAWSEGVWLDRRQEGDDDGIAIAPWPDEPWPGMAVTDEQGHYELFVEAGQVTVYAWAEGYGETWTELAVEQPGRDDVNLVLVESDEPGGGGSEPGGGGGAEGGFEGGFDGEAEGFEGDN